MHNIYSSLNRSSVAPLVLRLVLGSLFIWHGIDKFDAGLEMVEGGFRMWGVPAPALAAPVVAVTEIVAGAALILGLLTRLASIALAVVLLGALFWAKDIFSDNGTGIISARPVPGYELDLAYLAGLIALMFIGPGRWSIDERAGLEPTSDRGVSDVEHDRRSTAMRG